MSSVNIMFIFLSNIETLANPPINVNTPPAPLLWKTGRPASHAAKIPNPKPQIPNKTQFPKI